MTRTVTLWPILVAVLVVAVGAVLARARTAGLARELEHARRRDRRERVLADRASEGALACAPDGTVRELTAAARTVLGEDDAARVGAPLVDLLHPDDAGLARELLGTGSPPGAAGAHGGPVRGRVRHASGAWLDAELTSWRLEGPPELLVFVRNVAEQRVLERRLQHDAFRDALTGLGNRVLLLDRVRIALARRDRRGTSVAVLFLDLDDFKTVNDSLGHAAGDELLVGMADRLRSCLRPGDVAARLGGDEFAAVLEDIAEPTDAGEIAQRVLDALREPFVVAGAHIRVPASIGVAISGRGRDQPEELVRNADVAMYKAKERGKRRFEYFAADMRAGALAKLELRDALQGALDRGDFRLHYQPIVDLRTGTVAGAEALVRWQDQLRGLVPPHKFVPLAEETGLMDSIGRWVLRTACVQAKAWREGGLAQDFKVNVNLSARQLEQPGLAAEVDAVLRDVGLPPSALGVEITEDVFMQDSEELLINLLEIKELGVRLAIDDFGTGYSSLSYLQRFPVDYLKIDKSFVDDVGSGSSGGPALARAVIEIAHSLGLRVVAEGIERVEQLGELQRMGCDLGQGYHFAKPLAANDMESFLTRWETLLRAVGPEPAALTA